MRLKVCVGSFFGLALTLLLRAEAAQAACVSSAPVYTVPVPGRPFAVKELPDGKMAFASLNPENPSQVAGIAVLTCKADQFVYDRVIPLSPQPTGLALTPDGKLLVVADDSYIAFLHTDQLSAGRDGPVTYVKAEQGDIEDEDAGASYVSIAPDGGYAFVSEEQAGTVTVINLENVESGDLAAAIVADIDVGNAPISTLFSLDGKTLYGTVEIAHRKLGYQDICRPEGADASDTRRFPPGAIFSFDVAAAERGSRVVPTFAPSQCSAVRAALSPDGEIAWVTNRASGSVSAFDLEKLESGATPARVDDIAVGSNPVAVAATSDGRYVLAGITNRFGPGGTSAGKVAVVDAHTHKLVGTIPSGLFPREFSHGVGPTLFLSNNRSDTISVFNQEYLDVLIAKPASP